MTSGPRDGTVRVKLTISRDEHPAMFEALVAIQNPRRRSGRLKELVIKALTLEQVGVMAAVGPPLASGGARGAASNGHADTGLPVPTIASMLDWDASQSRPGPGAAT